jgi:hypothetical protein
VHEAHDRIRQIQSIGGIAAATGSEPQGRDAGEQ